MTPTGIFRIKSEIQAEHCSCKHSYEQSIDASELRKRKDCGSGPVKHCFPLSVSCAQVDSIPEIKFVRSRGSESSPGSPPNIDSNSFFSSESNPLGELGRS